MNVLFLLFTPRYGGAEIFIKNLIEKNDVINSYVLCSPGFFNSGLKNCREILYSNGIRALSRDYISLPLVAIRVIYNVLYLNLQTAFCLKKYKINIVHVNNISLSTYLLPLALVFKLINCKTKFIWQDHNLSTYKSYEKYFYIICSFIYSRTIVVSKVVSQKYKNKRKLDLLYMGIDTNRFKPDDIQKQKLRKEFIVGDKIVIGFLGIFSRGKGTEVLINKFVEISDYRQKAFLLMVGRFDDNEEFEKHIRSKLENSIKGNYKLIDWVEAVERYYSAIDILVNLTSINKREALGATILEAMSSECLVLVPNRDGPEEIVENTKNGFLFNANSEYDFLNKINYLTNNSNNLDSVRKQARETIIKKFSDTTMINEFNQILKKLNENS
ncbi:MAG TPA: glycosyltransferase family 4 protein [Ignavibacteriaceae bacterium]|nr:glycosyltransferase family 4 protein [Ignavibacteriaceae bacterium]